MSSLSFVIEHVAKGGTVLIFEDRTLPRPWVVVDAKVYRAGSYVTAADALESVAEADRAAVTWRPTTAVGHAVVQRLLSRAAGAA